MHGQGTYYYADGDMYTGEWQNDKRHGVGKVEYKGENGEVSMSDYVAKRRPTKEHRK